MKKSQKFKTSNGSEVYVWTPRGRLTLSVEQGSAKSTNSLKKGTLTILPSEGSRRLVRAALPETQGWASTTDGKGVAAKVTPLKVLTRRFSTACLALGVDQFKNAEVSPNAPAWAKNRFGGISHSGPATHFVVAEKAESAVDDDETVPENVTPGPDQPGSETEQTL